MTVSIKLGGGSGISELRAVWVIGVRRGPGGVFGVRLAGCRGRQGDLTHVS